MPDFNTIKEEISKNTSNGRKDDLNFGDDPVSKDELLSAWNEFIDDLKIKGRERESSTLKLPVVIDDDLTITLKLPNSFQSLTVEGLQQELLTYLRKRFNNGKIRLLTEVEKYEEKKMIYTNSEKFEYLANKFPQLRILKSRLDLDTDF